MYVGVQMSRARITRLVAVGSCLKLRGGPLAGWTQGVETMRGYLKSKHDVVVAAAGAALGGCGGVMPHAYARRKVRLVSRDGQVRSMDHGQHSLN